MNPLLTAFATFAFAALTACVTAAPLHFDPAQIRPYTFALESQKHLESPYVAKYEHDGKLLLYVASQHLAVEKYPDLLQHPTLKTTAALFAEYRPQVVIVEGIDTGAEVSPPKLVKHADECAASAYRQCGESFFAINAARKAGAAFVSGEPKSTEVRDQLVAAGYTAEDLLGFYLVRQIPQLRRQASFDPKTFPGVADAHLLRFQEQIGTKLAFDYVAFTAWYAKHMTDPKSVLDVTNDTPAPHGGPDATYVQKISNQVGVIRDRSVVERIGAMFAKYDRVLVVYGGSHLITQEPAFLPLGTPSYFRVP